MRHTAHDCAILLSTLRHGGPHPALSSRHVGSPALEKHVRQIFTRAFRLSLPTVEIGGYGLAAGRLVCCKTTEGLGLMI